MQLARVLGAVGRTCISAGVLTLLFVVYQLWGTGLREAQAQNRLETEFEDVLGEAGIDTDAISDGNDGNDDQDTTPTTLGPPPAPTAGGDALANLRIPAIGLEKIVVEGVSLENLKRGPGHYPDTPMPGQAGNVAIAGHRTTYGAPFNRIDELEQGDEILITTTQGAFIYRVSGQQIVSPSQVEVLEDAGDDRLTLTACHPKYSARQRIVVTAKLAGEAAPSSGSTPAGGTDEIPADPSEGADGDVGEGEDEDEPSTIDAGLSGEGSSAWPAVLLAFACALVWVAAWVLGLLWQRWPAYLTCLPVFLFMLFYFFESFSRLLPANY
jgi:sortase A